MTAAHFIDLQKLPDPRTPSPIGRHRLSVANRKRRRASCQQARGRGEGGRGPRSFAWCKKQTWFLAAINYYEIVFSFVMSFFFSEEQLAKICYQLLCRIYSKVLYSLMSAVWCIVQHCSTCGAYRSCRYHRKCTCLLGSGKMHYSPTLSPGGAFFCSLTCIEMKQKVQTYLIG